jgi:hypothetical protein
MGYFYTNMHVLVMSLDDVYMVVFTVHALSFASLNECD